MQDIAFDEIVEDRVWRNGIEIVSHVNWTQVARVRRSLGLAGETLARNPLLVAAEKPPVLTVVRSLAARSRIRAA